jgi:hypothetical protein
MKQMNQYKLISLDDGNNIQELDSFTFQDAVEEALDILDWYVVDDGDCSIAVNINDPNDVIDLIEQTFEDAQYEAVEKLGYFISSPV